MGEDRTIRSWFAAMSFAQLRNLLRATPVKEVEVQRTLTWFRLLCNEDENQKSLISGAGA